LENFEDYIINELKLCRITISLEPILEKISTIASGATPIGSAERAPDDVLSLKVLRRSIRATPIGSKFWLKSTQNIF
jgi:hypothetical protein